MVLSKPNGAEGQIARTTVPENALILQGGGSLGAYECGVFKALQSQGIEFDIFAGTSIGAINASIVFSARISNNDAAKSLEEFWLELAEYNIRPVRNINPFVPDAESESVIPDDKLMGSISAFYTAVYGNPKAFIPRWFMPGNQGLFPPFLWDYLYDYTPLKNTLTHYIDFESLTAYKSKARDSKGRNGQKNNVHERPRLLLTCTDIQTGEPVVFDSHETHLDIQKIVACTSYPFYGIRYDKIEGRYLWDGSLLTNTPMAEVVRCNPELDKNLYFVDVFPKDQKELPKNMSEVWHRARDIIFMDKTEKNIEKLKIIENYRSLLRKTFETIDSDESKLTQKTKSQLGELRSEYNELTRLHGARIRRVVRIGRVEKMHLLLEDADFSAYRVKKLIKEGEADARRVLEKSKPGF